MHEPVMVAETVEALAPSRGGLFLDCTVGSGGHAFALLRAGATRLIGLDRDREALARAAETLAPFADGVELVHSDYRDAPAVLARHGIDAVDGALADLGVSSMQLDDAGRGFSFRRDEPLDMRMDRSQGPTAADILRDVDEGELADVIFQFGEERFSRRIARAIVAARRAGPVATTGRLAEIVRRAIPSRGRQRIDPATRTFQALRIWVNRELDHLDAFLEDMVRLLSVGGRFAVISFHSLEDRIVKQTFRALVGGTSSLRLLTKRPVQPSDAEIARNPRSRSAKLRAIERLA
ncbi:MAG TPA: 16S rRNA (cytosine(1402)-N(4))-methyltransferase RsmH [Vicinamibacterales bacterium]|jgi:16S rRNA (cytosine1402-N4)-methyltransferase|nr:16S rRNA (cytosine(1402)-N(4))-methyltransferase RsmH [Vicinamibacterales bacterium]